MLVSARKRVWTGICLLTTLQSTLGFGAANAGCPLSNPIYKDLRLAAAALEKRVNLPAGCEEIEQKLAAAGKEVRNSVDQVVAFRNAQESGGIDSSTTTTFPSPSPSTSLGDPAQHVQIAVAGVIEMGKIFSRYAKSDDRCGKALLTDTDYAEALIDTVNGLAPYLIVFGGTGAATTALGASILGTAVKTFITIFKGTNFDMTRSDQRQAFIENSCGFYLYNESLRSLLQARDGEVSDMDRRIDRLSAELLAFAGSPPALPRPTQAVLTLDLELKQDQDRLHELTGIVERMTDSDSFVCYLVRTQTEKVLQTPQSAFPGMSVKRLNALLEDSEHQGLDTSARRPLVGYFNEVTQPDLYKPELYRLRDPLADPLKVCASRSHQWLSLVGELLGAMDAELGRPGRRDLRDSEAYKTRKKWEEDLAKKKIAFADAKRGQKFLHDLAGRGEEVEVSELLDTRDHVKNSLFSDESRVFLFSRIRRESPAEAWMEHKWREAGISLIEFKNLLPRIRREWLSHPGVRLPEADRTHACAYVENAAFTWMTAQRHIQASQLFCDTFSQTINDASFPRMAEYCLGKYDRDGRRTEMSILSKRAQEVAGFGSDVAAIYEWMRSAGCAMPNAAVDMLN